MHTVKAGAYRLHFNPDLSSEVILTDVRREFWEVIFPGALIAAVIEHVAELDEDE